MLSLAEFEKLDEYVIHYKHEPYVSLIHLGSVLGWDRDARKYKRNKLIEECDFDEELIIIWHSERGEKLPPSTINLNALLSGRRVGYFVNHEGIQQLLQWDKNPIAKPFRKFVRKSMKEYMTTGRLVAEEQKNNQLTISYEHKKLELDYCKYAMEIFPSCTRMKYIVKEKLSSVIGGQLALTEPKNLTITEVLERRGFARKRIYKYRSAFGRALANIWKSEGRGKLSKVYKEVNGHECAVNAYPIDYHETICTQWMVYTSDRD